MFEMVAIQSGKKQPVTPAETCLITSEESILVDADVYDLDDDLHFTIKIAGKRVGRLTRFARKSSDGKIRPNAPFWVAQIVDRENFRVQDCAGYGKTASEAIGAAFDSGTDNLRAAIRFALKVRAKIKRNPKCISLESEAR